MATNNEVTKGKKSKAIRYTLIGLGVGALGAAGYFSWRYFSSRKDSEVNTTEPEPSPAPAPKTPYKPAPKPAPASANDEFPLKRGSKGARVKVLQEALMAQYGKGILPKYGADSDFGKETEDALKKQNLPLVIDESTFNVITRQSKSSPGQLAQEIFNALFIKNFDKVMTGLKKIRSKDEYKQVSTAFQNYRLGLVRQTLVNAVLGTFPNEAQKQQLRLEFLRMGLRYDGSKWSLDGLSGLQLVTNKTARVWKDQKTFVDVPARTVLGTEIKRKGRYSLFENQGRYFLVPTTQVQYL